MPAELNDDTFTPFRLSVLDELHAVEAERRNAAATSRPVDPISNITWESYRGQEAVKSELLIRIHSALHRGTRMPHVLLTGGPGTGKTTVARLIAQELDRPFLAITHPPKSAAALGDALWGYEQGVVLLDEIHQFPKALVHAVMQLTEEGRIQAASTYEFPELTVVAATTELASLFRPLVSRFGCTPQFVDYTDEDMARMVADMAARCEIPLSRAADDHPNVDDGVALALAAGGNPRTARHLVEALRDLHVTGMPADAEAVLNFCGLSRDGLSRDHLIYLSTLAAATGGRAGQPALATMMGMAPGQIRQLESVLTRHRFIVYTPNGRQITSAGRSRVQAP